MTALVVESGLSRSVRITAWADGTLDRVGAAPGSAYAELVWLPRMGPASFLMWRLFCQRLDWRPDGFVITVDDLAVSLGLGSRRSPTAPVHRALARLERFEVVRPQPEGFAVRRRLPHLSARQVAQLPAPVRRIHAQLVNGGSRATAAGA